MHPKFWKNINIISILLLPAALLFCIATFLRNLTTSKYHAKVPVICVGNVTVGGAGKTPVVLAIADILRESGLSIAIASRGYKGEITKPTLVDKNRYTVNSVGDEPLMLARIAPTYIAAQRDLAVQMAENNGANVVIMDDGLQNPSVYKNISLLVIDGKFGIGNALVLPAGPLRETLSSGVRKCSAIIVIGKDETGILKHPALNAKTTPPILRARLEPHGQLPDPNVPYIAFAGIGNPEKFFSTLAENGYNIVETIPFADHYNYTDGDMNEIIHKAENKGARIITTEKDEVRLPLFAKKKVQVLPVKIAWEDETQIRNVLEKALGK